ncbi:hypothetical protein ABKN59_007040 [Abortiporus biennis]
MGKGHYFPVALQDHVPSALLGLYLQCQSAAVVHNFVATSSTRWAISPTFLQVGIRKSELGAIVGKVVAKASRGRFIRG